MLEWKLPFAKWFLGGELNISYNCLDRHVATWRKNKAAILWEGEPGDSRTLTYQQLLREVSKCANVLKSLGVKKGDRVAIYMGMVPELPIAMLACARIGAAHTVVFGGFSAQALIDRINDCGASAVITQDGAFRRGTEVKLKEAVDQALPQCSTVKNVLVYRRTGSNVTMQAGPRSLVARADGDRVGRLSRLSRWTPSIHSICSILPAPPANPRAFCTPPAAIRSAPTSPPSGSSICATKTRSGARPTSAG